MNNATKLVIGGCFIAIIVFVFRDRDPWTTVRVPAGTGYEDVFALDLYAPFDRHLLLEDAEATYGEPADRGDESKGQNHVFFKEYVAEIGRVRVYEERYPSEEGYSFSEWLVTYPGALYIEDLVSPKYLRDLPKETGDWKLSVTDSDRNWYVTVELEGRAVICIYDTPQF